MTAYRFTLGADAVAGQILVVDPATGMLIPHSGDYGPEAWRLGFDGHAGDLLVYDACHGYVFPDTPLAKIAQARFHADSYSIPQRHLLGADPKENQPMTDHPTIAPEIAAATAVNASTFLDPAVMLLNDRIEDLHRLIEENRAHVERCNQREEEFRDAAAKGRDVIEEYLSELTSLLESRNRLTDPPEPTDASADYERQDAPIAPTVDEAWSSGDVAMAFGYRAGDSTIPVQLHHLRELLTRAGYKRDGVEARDV